MIGILKNSNKVMLVLMMAALVAFTGCGSDGNDNPTDPGGNNGGNNSQGTILATLDGTAVDFSLNAAAVLDTDGYTMTGGDQTGGTTIIFSLPHASGNVDFGNMEYGITMTYGGSAWLADSITCTITSAETDNLVGTFSGTFQDITFMNSMTVTNGTFNVSVLDIR